MIQALLVLLLCTPALAQSAPPNRFAQPVRAGDLVGRAMLQPIEAQPILGRVLALTRRPDGGTALLVQVGTTLGFGGRPVAIPIEAVALLGEHVALLDDTPEQLAARPTAPPQPALPPDTIVKVGLVKPFH